MVVANKEANSERKREGVIIELRAKSQITLPKKLLQQVGMEEGDNFEAVVVDGQIRLIPVVIYPKAVVERWEREFIEAQRNKTAYDSVDAAIDDVERKYDLTSTADE